MLQIAGPSSESVLAISLFIFDTLIDSFTQLHFLLRSGRSNEHKRGRYVFTPFFVKKKRSYHLYLDIVNRQNLQKKAEERTLAEDASKAVLGLYGGRLLVAGSVLLKSRTADSVQLMMGLDLEYARQLQERGLRA